MNFSENMFCSLTCWGDVRWLQWWSARTPIQMQRLSQLRPMQSVQSERISQRALDERNSTTEQRSKSSWPGESSKDLDTSACSRM